MFYFFFLFSSSACMNLEEYHTAKAALERGASLSEDALRFTKLIEECEKHIAGLHSWQPLVINIWFLWLNDWSELVYTLWSSCLGAGLCLLWCSLLVVSNMAFRKRKKEKNWLWSSLSSVFRYEFLALSNHEESTLTSWWLESLLNHSRLGFIFFHGKWMIWKTFS